MKPSYSETNLPMPSTMYHSSSDHKLKYLLGCNSRLKNSAENSTDNGNGGELADINNHTAVRAKKGGDSSADCTTFTPSF